MTENRKQETAAVPASGVRQFGTILNFELRGCLLNKANIIFTVILVAVIVAVTFFPRIRQMIGGGKSGGESAAVSDSGGIGADAEGSDPGGTGAGSDASIMLLRSDAPENDQLMLETFAAAFTGYQVLLTEQSTDEIEEQILAEEAVCAFVMDSPTSYVYYVKDLSMNDQNTRIADELLGNIYSVSAMMRAGMTSQEASAALSAQIGHEVVNLGKDQIRNFLYTYIMIFALYMVILLYGQMITTNVAMEKSSRAMELLITSAKPVSMMFGKVIASCLSGLMQLLVIFGSGLLCFRVNQEYWLDNPLIASIFNIPVWLLGYMIVFFVLGFLIYAFLYGAIGSTVSKLEDINSAVMPVTMVFVAAFIVTMMALGNGTVDSSLMKICSYVPFTSPMAMFTRIAMSTVPFYEIVISILILLVSTIGVGVISAKIYRVGVLLYGTKIKLRTIWNAVRKA